MKVRVKEGWYEDEEVYEVEVECECGCTRKFYIEYGFI